MWERHSEDLQLVFVVYLNQHLCCLHKCCCLCSLHSIIYKMVYWTCQFKSCYFVGTCLFRIWRAMKRYLLIDRHFGVLVETSTLLLDPPLQHSGASVQPLQVNNDLILVKSITFCQFPIRVCQKTLKHPPTACYRWRITFIGHLEPRGWADRWTWIACEA